MKNRSTGKKFNEPFAFQQAAGFHQSGQLEKAEALYRKILKFNPKNADVLHFLGMLVNMKGQYEEACQLIGSATKLMALNPSQFENFFNAKNNYGNALRDAGKVDQAITVYQETLERQPNRADTHNNLGNAFRDINDPERAIQSYNTAIRIHPNYADAYANRGNALRDLGRLNEAIKDLRRCLALNPNHAGAHSNLGSTLLAKGEFTEGWVEYEWRWAGHGWQKRNFPIPDWNGSELGEKTILVSAEQGVGDEIMFASCIPDLVKQAGHVILEADPRLVPLFSRSFPAATVHHGDKRDPQLSWLKEIPRPEVHISAASLPRFLRPDLNSFPKHFGYLTPDPGLKDQWRQRLSELKPGLMIGISWRGGNSRQMRNRRSISLIDWAPILTVPGCRFVNLQYGDCSADLARASASNLCVHDWPESNPLLDLDGFAAQIANLDLVISVDNSTVHMAGALNIPTWILQPAAPDWRWLVDQEDSYWYPSLRNFFQNTLGDWQANIEVVTRELAKLTNRQS